MSNFWFHSVRGNTETCIILVFKIHWGYFLERISLQPWLDLTYFLCLFYQSQFDLLLIFGELLFCKIEVSILVTLVEYVITYKMIKLYYYLTGVWYLQISKACCKSSAHQSCAAVYDPLLGVHHTAHKHILAEQNCSGSAYKMWINLSSNMSIPTL